MGSVPKVATFHFGFVIAVTTELLETQFRHELLFSMTHKGRPYVWYKLQSF
jgi:hypothetical protein